MSKNVINLNRRWFSKSLFAVGMVTVLIGCNGGEDDQAGADSNEDVSLVAATINPGSSLYGEALTALSEAIEEETDGEIEIEVYPDGQLGDASSIYQSVISGDIDIIYSDTGWFSEHQPAFDVLDSYYLFDGQEHFESVVNESDDLSYFEDLLRENPGLETLMYAGGLERNIMSTFPIESIDDLQGQTMRSGGTSMEEEWWGRLGASPTNIDLDEVYSAIQTGVADGTQNSLDSMIQQQFGEVADYVARTQHVFDLAFVVMNGETYNNLSEEHQEAISDATESVQSEFIERAFEEAEENREILETEFDVTFTEPDLEEFIETSNEQRMEVAEELGVADVVSDIFD